MKDVTVLMTAAGTPAGPGLAECLKNNGERRVKLIGTDMQNDPSISQFYDKVYYAPSSSSDEYVPALLEICEKEHVDVLLPCISKELPILQERYNDFLSIGTKVSVTRSTGLLVANDKIKLYEYMREHDYSMPKFTTITSIDKFEDACREVGYPQKSICVKMRDGSGSRGIRIINPNISRYDIFANEKPNSFFTTYEDLISILSEVKELPELMIMEYLPGKEYSVDVIADKGHVKYIVGRESNVILASIPQEATVSYNKKAYELATRIVGDLQLDGIIDFDFKFDADGHPQLMEINPRVPATLSIYAAAGINMLYLQVKLLMGEELPKVDVKYGTKLKRRYLDFFYDQKDKPIKI